MKSRSDHRSCDCINRNHNYDDHIFISFIKIYIYIYTNITIINYKVPNGGLTNGIRYILNKESLFSHKS